MTHLYMEKQQKKKQHKDHKIQPILNVILFNLLTINLYSK